MRILFVITARGGSKGVPRKNIRKIGGLSLLAYKIISAQKCKYEKRILVTTDNIDIANEAKKYGDYVPFIRPDYLASDEASSMDVVMHAVEWAMKNDNLKYDAICLLEPSSPFTRYIDLDNAFDVFFNNDVDTMLGVRTVEVTRNFIWPLDSRGGLSLFYEEIKNLSSVRRQDQAMEYTLNGCMYISRWDYFIENKMFHSNKSLPYIMPEEYSIEIDSMLDYYFADMLVKKKIVDINYWR